MESSSPFLQFDAIYDGSTSTHCHHLQQPQQTAGVSSKNSSQINQLKLPVTYNCTLDPSQFGDKVHHNKASIQKYILLQYKTNNLCLY
jgi:hypothetical protein